MNRPERTFILLFKKIWNNFKLKEPYFHEPSARRLWHNTSLPYVLWFVIPTNKTNSPTEPKYDHQYQEINADISLPPTDSIHILSAVRTSFVVEGPKHPNQDHIWHRVWVSLVFFHLEQFFSLSCCFFPWLLKITGWLLGRVTLSSFDVSSRLDTSHSRSIFGRNTIETVCSFHPFRW